MAKYPYKVTTIKGGQENTKFLKNPQQFKSRIAYLKDQGYTIVEETDFSAKLEWPQ